MDLRNRANGEAAYLGVDASLTGRRWQLRASDERAALALAQRFGLPEVVGRVLAGRGVGLDQAAAFLDPTLRAALPDPSRLKDMDRACERLAAAIMGGEAIAVFGDYDVDGATSTALLSRYLKAVGARARIYIPDRIAEGYGPNAPALARLKREGAGVAITVDCGTGAHAALAAARADGLDVIVADHHAAEVDLPPAFAVVNPNRLDDGSGQGMLAAVGVVFLMLVGLNRALRAAGWFKTRPDRGASIDASVTPLGVPSHDDSPARPEPDLLQWLDIVALGTVCDVVPLIGLNRALVTQGLKVMAGRGNAGIAALADVAGLAEPPEAYHAGFVLGPRVNAGGRIGAPNLGARILATDDAAEAAELARKLDALNRERQAIEARVLDDAIAAIEAEGGAHALAFAAGEGWHPGVVGIVAARLKERYNVPACVVALAGETGTGSGRSVAGVDLGACVIAARQAGLLLKGGGHAMAAGFTAARDQLPALRAFLEERIATRVREARIVPTLSFDGSLRPDGATAELAEALARVGPFGSGNPEPRFALAAARIGYAAPAGDAHVRLTITPDGPGRPLKAIAFRCLDTDLGRALLAAQGGMLHLAGKLRLDTWNGAAGVQLVVEDAALP
ncbi:MAG: single-stranded-DNA-specific exonuclease RecJ [Acidimicrobiia bacterium]|nr:single-stranded-DNA-specific exonuclease RecJ [Acidimicrobiia bacterium]